MLKVKFTLRNDNREFEHICFDEDEMMSYIDYYKSHWGSWSIWDINEETGKETENYNL